MTEILESVTGNIEQSPMYKGDLDRSLKELGYVQRKILDLQLTDLARLNETELHSELFDRILAGDTSLPIGTLMHGTRYSPEVVSSIATYGVMSGELFGKTEDGETHYCADFFKIDHDTTVADYSQWVSENEPNTGALKVRRMEGNYLPSPKTRDERMGIIIDPNVTEVRSLFEADAYREGTDELFQGIINHLPIDKNSPKAERVAAILGGIPRGAIAGIVVSQRLAENSEHMNEVFQAFNSRMPILSVAGELLATGEADNS